MTLPSPQLMAISYNLEESLSQSNYQTVLTYSPLLSRRPNSIQSPELKFNEKPSYRGEMDSVASVSDLEILKLLQVKSNVSISSDEENSKSSSKVIKKNCDGDIQQISEQFKRKKPIYNPSMRITKPKGDISNELVN